MQCNKVQQVQFSAVEAIWQHLSHANAAQTPGQQLIITEVVNCSLHCTAPNAQYILNSARITAHPTQITVHSSCCSMNYTVHCTMHTAHLE